MHSSNHLRLSVSWSPIPRLIAAVLALSIVTIVQAGPAPTVAPSVGAVEPPNWFAGHPMRSIQLLVRGAGLRGATLVSRTPHISVERQTVNERGTYLIARVTIAAGARPGPADLVVRSGESESPVPFALVERLPESEGFRGLTPDDVIYLVMPDRFADGKPSPDTSNVDRGNPRRYHGGDLRGVISKLEYLRDLGVTAIWMTPIYDNDDAGSAYHGYHATDFYGVEEHFGSAEDLRELVRAAHAHGIKVVQDQVANHVGPAHLWVDDPPTPTWLNGTRDTHVDNVFKVASLLPGGDPVERKATLEGWFGGHLPDLNQGDPEASQYLIQNSLWWLETFGFDAIRQDTLPYVPREFMRDWAAAIDQSRPTVNVVGEVLDGDEKLVSYFQGGRARDGIDTGIESLFDFPLSFAAKELALGVKPAERVAQVLAGDALYPDPMALVPLLENHDMARFVHQTRGDLRKVKLARTILYTSRGALQIYYGEEIALPGGRDPDNRRDFPGGFPGDTRDAFTDAGRTPEEREMFEHLRGLLRLRREHAALRGPVTRVVRASGVHLAYTREAGRERALVAVNAGPVPAVMELELGRGWPRVMRNALSRDEVYMVSGGRLTITVPAMSAEILVDSPATRPRRKR